MRQEWLFKSDGHIHGPFSSKALVEEAKAGRLKQGDLVSVDAGENWRSANSVRTLADVFASKSSDEDTRQTPPDESRTLPQSPESSASFPSVSRGDPNRNSFRHEPFPKQPPPPPKASGGLPPVKPTVRQSNEVSNGGNQVGGAFPNSAHIKKSSVNSLAIVQLVCASLMVVLFFAPHILVTMTLKQTVGNIDQDWSISCLLFGWHLWFPIVSLVLGIFVLALSIVILVFSKGLVGNILQWVAFGFFTVLVLCNSTGLGLSLFGIGVNFWIPRNSEFSRHGIDDNNWVSINMLSQAFDNASKAMDSLEGLNRNVGRKGEIDFQFGTLLLPLASPVLVLCSVIGLLAALKSCLANLKGSS